MKNILVLLIVLFSSEVAFSKTPENIITDIVDSIDNESWHKLGKFYAKKDQEELKSLLLEYMDVFGEGVSRQMLDIYFQGKTLDEVKRMKPEIFIGTFVSQIFIAARKADPSMKFGRTNVLGGVKVSDTQYHYITEVEATIFNETVAIRDVVSLSKSGGRWYMDLPTDYILARLKLKKSIEMKLNNDKQENKRQKLESIRRTELN